MSYYSSYRASQTPFEKFKEVLPFVAIGTFVVLAVAWVIAEFACTRSFVGTLSSKEAAVCYSYDHERTEIKVHTDKDGNTHVSTHHRGSDETVAHINYKLAFYSEGELRNISAGKFSGRVGRVNADEAAYQTLMSNHTEPGLYTHTRKDVTYLVTVSGWLLDGTLVDAVDVNTLPAEK
jgi:hypothetical protein